MKLIKLVINDREGVFGDHTLITSKDNSTGKTTFIRLLLFSMGWNIPSTRKLDFNKVITRLYFENNKQFFQYIRKANKIHVYKNKESLGTFDVSDDLTVLLNLYSSISHPQLLSNFLGTFYFDQEEGWNWLSKGKVIGGNRFNLDEFVEGLMDSDQSDLRSRIAKNKLELKGYNLLKRNLSYKQIVDNKNELSDWNSFDSLNAKLRNIDFKLSSLRQNIKSINKAQTNDKQFISMISEMKLRIKITNNKEVLVTKDNIVGFNEHRYFIKARLAILKRQEMELLMKKAKIKINLQKFTKLFNIQSQLDWFNKSISKLNISVETVDRIIKDIRKENLDLKRKLNKTLSISDYSDEIQKTVIKFCKELKVDEYIDPTKEFIYSNNLQKYTGAILHLIVFAFHMSYLYILQQEEGQTYPIIIDSPYGNEITDDNVKIMYKLLKKYFPNNQIITASIHDVSKFYSIDKRIIFSDTMMKSLSKAKNVEESLDLKDNIKKQN